MLTGIHMSNDIQVLLECDHYGHVHLCQGLSMRYVVTAASGLVDQIS